MAPVYPTIPEGETAHAPGTMKAEDFAEPAPQENPPAEETKPEDLPLVTTAPPSALKAEDFEERAPSLLPVYQSVSHVDPDRAAKVLDLSRQTGQPQEYVNSHLDALSKQLNVTPEFLADLEKKNPGTTKFLQNPENLAVFQDDLKNLAEHENIFKSAARGFARTGESTATFFEGTPLAENFGNALENARQRFENYLDANPEPTTQGLANRIVEGIGEFLPQLPGLAINPTAAIGMMGGLKAQESFKASLEAGLNPNVAAGSALTKGSVTAATMYLPMKWLGEAYGTLLGKVGVDAAKSAIAQSAWHMAQSAVGMGAQSEIQLFADSLTNQVTGEDPHAFDQYLQKATQAGVEGTLSGLVLGAPPFAIHAGRFTGEKAMDLYERIGKKSKESKAATRAPEQYQEALKEQVAGSGMETTIINREAFDRFFQEGKRDPAEMAKDLGVEESYHQSAETGMGFEVPTETWTVKMRNDPAYEALKGDIKYSHSDLTANEEATQKQEMEATAKEAETEAGKEPKPAEPPVGTDEQIKALHRQIEEELKKGGFAKAYAAQITEVFKNIAAMQKTAPLDFFKKVVRKLTFSKYQEEGPTAEEMGMVSPADLMKKQGWKVLAETPEQVADFKDQGIPVTLDPKTQGALKPQALAEGFFEAARTGIMAREYLPQEWFEEGEKGLIGRPDATHDTVREIIRNGGSGVEAVKKLKQSGLFQEGAEGQKNWEELWGIKPAVRGETGIIYTGANHGEANAKGTQAGESFGKREQFGFQLKDGSFITRDEAQKRFGFRTSEELRRLRGEGPTAQDVYYQEGPSIADRILAQKFGQKFFQTGVLQTETPEFKRWFGDSKVVDANGKPLVVYHQTTAEAEKGIKETGFDITKGRARLTDEGVPDGFFFKPTPENMGLTAQGPHTEIPVFLSIKNPFVVSDRYDLAKKLKELDPEYDRLAEKAMIRDLELGREFKVLEKNLRDNLPEGKRSIYSDKESSLKEDEFLEKWKEENVINATKARARLTEVLKKEGYDGLVMETDQGSRGRKTKTFIAFEPTQIKSAVENRGTFDPNNPNILKQGEETPGKERGFLSVGGEPGARDFNVFIHAQRGDKSSILHEAAHSFWIVLDDLVKTGEATKETQEIHSQLLKWFGVKDSTEVRRDHHEQFAKGMEWVMRGYEIPKDQPWIKRAFHLFRKWLLETYPNASDFMARYFPKSVREMPQDVKDVYLRLLASKDEIARAAHETGMTQEFLKGVPLEARARVKDLESEALAQAEDELLKPQLAELTQEHQAFLEKEAVKAQKDAQAEVDQLPVAQAMAALDKYFPGQVKEMADLFLENPENEKAVPLITEAAERGYTEPEELAKDLKNFDREGEVQRRTSAAMAKYKDMRLTPEIRDKAVAALHNDRMDELMALKTEILKEMQFKNRKVNREERMAQVRAAKESAQQIMSAKPWKGTPDSAGAYRHGVGDPNPYLTAEKKAAMDMGKALAKKDEAAYAKAQKRYLLNRALVGEALKNRAEVKKILDKLRPYAQRGRNLMGMPFGHGSVLDQVLERFGFKQPNPLQEGENQTQLQIAMQLEAEGETPQEIANQTGFMRDESGWRRETLQDLIVRANNDAFPIGLPPEWNSQLTARKAEDLTLKQLRIVRDLVSDIAHNGKQADKFFDESVKAGIKQSAADLLANVTKIWGTPKKDAAGKPVLDDNDNPVKELPHQAEMMRWGSGEESQLVERMKAVTKLPSAFVTSLKTLLGTARVLDQGEDGPAHQMIYRLMEHGLENKLARMEKAMKEREEILKKFYTPKEFAELRKKVYTEKDLPFLKGDPLNREEVIGILSNMSAVPNRERLNHKWSDDQLRQLVDLLPEKDHHYVQAVWDHLQTFWPDIVRQERMVRGRDPKQKEFTPVETKWGTLKGGYYPIDYNPEKSAEAMEHHLTDTADFMKHTTGSAHTNSGYTKETVASVKRTLSLTQDVLINHYENLIHDLAFRAPVIDFARLIKQRAFKQTILNTLGIDHYRLIGDYLKNIASDQKEAGEQGARVLNWLRNAYMYFGVAMRPVMMPVLAATNTLNVGRDNAVRLNREMGVGELSGQNVLNHFSGYGGAVRDVWNTMWNYKKTKEWIESVSPPMKQRYNLRDATLGEMQRRFRGESDFVRKYAFMPEYISDSVSSMATFQDRYKRTVDKVGSEKAADLAWEAVVNAVGSGSLVDKAMIQRGKVMKNFTFAYSWNNMMFNRYWQDYKRSQLAFNQGKAAEALAISGTSLMLMWGVGGVTEAYLRGLFSGQPDEEKRKRSFITRIAEQGFSIFPILRDVAPPVIEALQGEPLRGLELDVYGDAMKTLMQPFGDVHLHFLEERFWEHTVDAAALLAHSPKSLVTAAFNYLDWLKGDGKLTWQEMIGARRHKH